MAFYDLGKELSELIIRSGEFAEIDADKAKYKIFDSAEKSKNKALDLASEAKEEPFEIVYKFNGK